MPKLVFHGNGTEEYDYYVVCGTCYSMLKCEEDEIREKTIRSEFTYHVDCRVCETEKRIAGSKYLIAKGIPTSAVANHVAGMTGYFEERKRKKESE